MAAALDSVPLSLTFYAATVPTIYYTYYKPCPNRPAYARDRAQGPNLAARGSKGGPEVVSPGSFQFVVARRHPGTVGPAYICPSKNGVVQYTCG